MKKIFALAALCALSAGLLLPTSANAQAAHSSYPHSVTSDSAAVPVAIDITVYKPGSASAENPVPVVLFSHGWGGSKADGAGRATAYNDADIGYVTITQRGHGASGGEANVQDPELETEDIEAVIDYVASLNWVKKDVDEEGNPIANDPVLGAVGASYGGGYQTMAALDEIAETGATRFNALAPQITWYDLPESLAPQDVIRGTWNAVLYGSGKARARLPEFIDEAFRFGTATAQWPDGKFLDGPNPLPVPIPDIDSRFHEHGPVAFVENGHKIDVPVLLRQGTSDNLFNLNQGLKIFTEALTADARSQSLFVGYNGGHALPNALPAGQPVAAEVGGGDQVCSTTETIDGWNDLELEFFNRVFDGEATDDLLPARYNITDVSGEFCHRFDSTESTIELFPTRGIDPTESDGMIATAGLGAPIHIPLEVEAGTSIVGVPILSGKAYAAAVDTRVFFGLSMGYTPADAQVIQNNLMPLHFEQPAAPSQKSFEIELPGVAVTLPGAGTVPAGKTLFLTITPVSDMFFGSRTPGGMVLTDLKLKLPIL